MGGGESGCVVCCFVVMDWLTGVFVWVWGRSRGLAFFFCTASVAAGVVRVRAGTGVCVFFLHGFGASWGPEGLRLPSRSVSFFLHGFVASWGP